jgi:hypothetical protein
VWKTSSGDRQIEMKVEPDQAPLFLDEWSALGALATLAGTFFAMFVVLGAGFTAIVLAVARDRMFAQFAGAFGAIAFTVTADHVSDSMVVVVRAWQMRPVPPV